MRKTYRLEDLDCANCAAKMETAIRKLPGVKDASVSFLTQKMIIEADDVPALMPQIVRCISRVEPDCRVIMK